LGSVYIPFIGWVQISDYVYKDCTIVIICKNAGGAEVARLKPGEARNFSFKVKTAFPTLEFTVSVTYTILIPLLNIDYTASDKTDVVVNVNIDDYASVAKRWKAMQLGAMEKRLRDAESEMNRLLNELDNLLGEWLDDKKPSRELLPRINSIISDYQNLVNEYVKLQKDLVSFCAQQGILPPRVEKTRYFRLVKSAAELPPRERLEMRLRNLESEMATLVSTLRIQLNELRQLTDQLQGEVAEVVRSYKVKMAQLGAAFARASTEAEKKAVLAQRDAYLESFIAEVRGIIAKYEIRKNNLLEGIIKLKKQLEEKLNTFNYLRG